MRIFDFVSVKLTLLLIFGIVLGFYSEPPVFPTFLFLMLCLCLLAWAWKIQQFFEWSLAFSMLGFGVLITLISLGRASPNHYSNFETDSIGVWQVKITDVLKPNAFQDRYIVEVKSFKKEEAQGKLILNIAKDTTLQPLHVDDALLVLAQIQEIRPALNPHQFDYKDYLKKQGIHHQLLVKPQDLLQTILSRATIYGSAMRIRDRLISNLSQEEFDKDVLGVIQALLLGKRDYISEETYTDYKNAGAIHILAVSGLHVGVLLFLFQFLLQPLTYFPKGNTLRLLLVVLLLWGYAFLVGLSASVTRAVTMFSFVAYAQYLNRPTNTFNIIALSMLFILLVKPLYVFQVGFQMSYAAVFFIVWIYPQLQRFWYPDSYLLRKIWQLLSVSLAAQLGVLPISLYYFHQFPALFFISNLLIIPFLGVILGIGVLTLGLALINSLPEVLVVIYNYIFQTMNGIISWVAHQESFVFQEIPMNATQMVLVYVSIIGLVLFLNKRRFKNALVFCSGIIGLQILSIWSTCKTGHSESVHIAHSSKTSILLHQHGENLLAQSTDSTQIDQIIQNFKVEEQLDSVQHHSLKNVFQVQELMVYRTDSLAVFPPLEKVDVLWLSQSPKINLNRWLDSLQPKLVIIDGTNYHSYVMRWKVSCLKRELPFHDTREKGAYYFNSN